MEKFQYIGRIKYNGQANMPAHYVRISRLCEGRADSTISITLDGKPLILIHDVGAMTVYTDFKNIELKTDRIFLKSLFDSESSVKRDYSWYPSAKV